MRQDFLFPQIDLPDLIYTDDALENLIDYLPQEKLKAYLIEQKEEIKNDKLWKFGYENFFNEDGSHWEMSPGELAIFRAIVFKEHPKVIVVSSTQYGKTITIARGVLTRITHHPEDYLVTVPDLKRGKILLTYMMYDTANNPMFKTKLFGIPEKEKSKLERLLEERSKVRLTYQVVAENNKIKYGSVQLLSTQARIKQNAITAIMGFGGANIINDESPLVDDEIDAGIFRMIAGKPGETFLMKVGNPFFRNHFLDDWKKEEWYKIYINSNIGLAEGRYKPDIIEEGLKKPRAAVLWESRFPKEGAADRENWIPLLTDSQIQRAIQPAVHYGNEKLGVDPASSGSNEAVIVNRSRGFAEILLATDSIDPMDFTGQVFIRIEDTRAMKIITDKIGEGSGVHSRISEVNRVDKENKYQVFGVNSQEKAFDHRVYVNKRAEMFFAAKKWIETGGKLSHDHRWFQLTKVRYKEADSSGRIKIMPKDEMKLKLGVDDLGAADALALTFHTSDKGITLTPEEKFFAQKMRQKEKKKRSEGYKLKMT